MPLTIDNPKLKTQPISVGLVCAPFFSMDCPSIQIGLMAAIACDYGANAKTLHLNLDLAKLLTPEKYNILCAHRERMTGDWLFSIAAFGDKVDKDDQGYFDAFPDEIDKLCHKLDCDRQYLTNLRHQILPEFIDQCVLSEQWQQFDVIGFTSTFQQNVASLALAQRIKRTIPSIKIIFGGANFEDEMGPEYLRVFDFIDFAVIGEGDQAFPALLRQIENNNTEEQILGVAGRINGQVVSMGAAPAYQDLDAQPIPIYDEYFHRLEALKLNESGEFGRMIPFEGSRGCWWGAKHHCTFCGLNGMGMAYRSKSPERLLREFSELSHRHRATSFEAVDNILDMKYLKTLFSFIETQKLDYTFFFEVKANLRREQIKQLQRGGVRWIQPGIESLSSHVLKLMDKGCTMLQNVQLLKWARYYKIKTGWNILWGFPGETIEDYEDQLRVAKLISHLEPPNGSGRIWLERFSPYFSNQDKYPISHIRAESSYRYVYPDEVDVQKIAYFFEYEMAETADFNRKGLEEWIEEWQNRWDSTTRDSMAYRVTDKGILIDDDRGEARRGTYTFESVLAEIYVFCCLSIRSFKQINAYLLSCQKKYNYTTAEIQFALDEFCRLGLMITENDKYYGLALPSNPNF